MGERGGATMVRSKRIKYYLALAILVFIILMISPLKAAEDIDETIDVTLNDIGDGHVVDTLVYPYNFYQLMCDQYKNTPNLLVRKNLGSAYSEKENKNINVKFDDNKKSIVITYDSLGMIYRHGGVWTYPMGKETKLVSRSGNSFNFTSVSSNVSSIFTLDEKVTIMETWHINIPKSAADAKYDSNTGDITYKLGPFVLSSGARWAIIVVLILAVIIFVLVFLVCLFLLIRGIRKAKKVTLVTAPGVIEVGTPAAVVIEEKKEEAVVAPEEKPTITPSEEAKPRIPSAGHKFCIGCGKEIHEQAKFCPYCDAKQEE